MFQKSSKQQPIYLQKKKLFHHSIRKRDRQIIINKLRKKAQLPNHLQEIITNLPKQIKQFIYQIVQCQLKQWEETIAQSIVNQMSHKLKEIFDYQILQPNELISFFIFLLNKSNREEEVYKEYYQFIKNKSNLWSYPNKIHIFAVFNFMLKKGHSFVLEDAQKFHSALNSNRFFESQLYFYDIIIRRYPSSHNLTFFLPNSTLRRLSQQIEPHFYSDQQRIKMIQILIQVLYASEEQEISKCLELPKLFTRLQYLIGYSNKNKLLVDRSILLIYNINIDATSKTLVNHSCFDIIINQMKDKDNHMKIRSLLAELYINCILNYPKEEYYAFLTSNICNILGHYQYIVEEFNHIKEIQQFIIQLLTSMLTHCHQQEQNKQETPIMSSIKAQASLLNKLSVIQQCQCLLQEFKILKT